MKTDIDFLKIEELNNKGHNQEWRIEIYMRIKAIMLELEAATLLLAAEQKEINGGTYKNAIDYIEKAKLLIGELIDIENPKEKLTYMGKPFSDYYCPKCGGRDLKEGFEGTHFLCVNCGVMPVEDLIPQRNKP